MKEWIKKLLIILIIFGIIYIALYNIVDIDTSIKIPKDVKAITTANKNMAIGALSIIGVSAVIEIYSLIKYINKTVSKETFKTNIIKLILISVSLVIISTLCYFIYLFTSVTRIAV